MGGTGGGGGGGGGGGAILFFIKLSINFYKECQLLPFKIYSA